MVSKNFYRFIGVWGRRLRTTTPIFPVPSFKILIYAHCKQCVLYAYEQCVLFQIKMGNGSNPAYNAILQPFPLTPCDS